MNEKEEMIKKFHLKFLLTEATALTEDFKETHTVSCSVVKGGSQHTLSSSVTEQSLGTQV